MRRSRGVHRRKFIAVAAGAAAWPVVGRADTGPVRRLGILMNGTDAQPVGHENLNILIESLRALGWDRARNLRLDIRWGGDEDAGFDRGAAELLALGADVLVASTSPATAALRRRTGAVPIIFVIVTDPVGQGFVASLARPGGNVTGFSNYDAPMAGKWLELLKEVAPRLSTAGLLLSPDTATYAPLLQRALQDAGAALAVTTEPAPARDDRGIDEAFAAFAQRPGGGIIVGPDTFTTAHRERIIAAAARFKVPAIYPYRHFVDHGGLIGYGIVLGDLFRRAASYVDRVLKGSSPAELPVQAPARFELAVNVSTAKTLGLTVPQSLMNLADEVVG